MSPTIMYQQTRPASYDSRLYRHVNQGRSWLMSGKNFDKKRNRIYGFIAVLALAAILVISAGVASAGLPTNVPAGAQGQTNLQAQQGALSTAATGGPLVIRELKHDISPPLSSIPPAPAQPRPSGEREQGHRGQLVPGNQDTDTVVQFSPGPGTMPAPIVSFDGI